MVCVYVCVSWLLLCVCAKWLQLCPTLWDPKGSSPTGSSAHGASPGKNSGVGCRALLHVIFPTQGSKTYLLCLLYWQVGSLSLAPPGKPVLGHLFITSFHIVMSVSVIYLAWCSLNFFLWIYTNSSNLETFSYYFFKYLLCTVSSKLWNSSYIYIFIFIDNHRNID